METRAFRVPLTYPLSSSVLAKTSCGETEAGGSLIKALTTARNRGRKGGTQTWWRQSSDLKGRSYQLAITLAALVAVATACSAPIPQERHQPTPVRPGDIRHEPTRVNVDEIQEEVVRALFDDDGNFFGTDQRLAKVATEHEGGFGGYYFDERDKSHVYVFMMDPSKTASAEAAFREAYDGRHTVTRVTPVQGQHPFDQLVAWSPVLDRALIANDIHPTIGAVMEICNRIYRGLWDESQIADARRVLRDLEIPQDAVVFEQARPVLLGEEPSWQPMVDRLKHLFRSGADDARSVSYGSGQCW